MGDATSRAEHKRLKKAERMYLYAVEKAGYKYVNDRIEEDDEEDVDSDEEIKYNRTKPAKYISRNKVGIQVTTEIHSKLKKLYGDIDGIADNIRYSLKNDINGDIFVDVDKPVVFAPKKEEKYYMKKNDCSAADIIRVCTKM